VDAQAHRGQDLAVIAQLPLHVIGTLAVAVALPLAWWALTMPAGRPSDSRLLLGSRTEVPSASDERARRRGPGLSTRLLLAISPPGRRVALERQIAFAGDPDRWPIRRVIAAKLLGGALGLVASVAMTGGDLSIQGVAIVVGSAGLGFQLPDLLIKSKADAKRAALTQELPGVLDQMMVAVEAGLGFDAALVRAARNGDGALATELARAMQEIQFGVARAEALRNLAERTQVPELRRFVTAIVQADQYGIPLAGVLRKQAAEQRSKRRQRAEEQAAKIPVKVLLPLMFCILPTMFIVILGPIFLSFRDASLLGGP
jgi:tight adherence protein C